VKVSIQPGTQETAAAVDHDWPLPVGRYGLLLVNIGTSDVGLAEVEAVRCAQLTAPRSPLTTRHNSVASLTLIRTARSGHNSGWVLDRLPGHNSIVFP